ncbi:MAG: hypothetical protein WC798_03605 [Candidatus Paceibacterota bacterium]|jgi:hypothetical protein
MEEDKFSSYTYGEGKTGLGRPVNFTCRPEEKEVVRDSLERIRTIDIPTTHRVNVGRGTYGSYSRYDITQHKYGGSGHPGAGGYKEVLEIKHPPDGRWGIVVNEYLSHSDFGSGSFTEWETLQDALGAFEAYWRSNKTDISKLPGFKQHVTYGLLTPWFYAIGDEELVGDYAFPEGLQDDPVYRFGRQFVVLDNDVLTIKTCMGTRFISVKSEYRPQGENTYRLIYWDDGSVWKKDIHYPSTPPRPLEEGELWITEAMQQFKQLLAGKSTEFTINFTDGNKFVGKVVKANSKALCAEGRYTLSVHFKGGGKPAEGFQDFKPTPQFPDIISFITGRYRQVGKEVERIEVKKIETAKSGKKWSGVFFNQHV